MYALDIAEMYAENTEKGSISSYCAGLILGCVREAFSKRGAEAFENEFFPFFFRKWLPYSIGAEEKSVLPHIYPQAEDFCGYVDSLLKTDSLSALKRDVCLKEALRILCLKSELALFVKSPLIGRSPEVIDFQKYKTKRERRAGCIVEKGLFEVMDIFANNSVVLKKISGYTFFMRFYVNEAIIKTIHPGDVLELVVKKDESLNKRTVEDVLGCFSGESYA